jgi:AraC-like DNA-binding protein
MMIDPQLVHDTVAEAGMRTKPHFTQASTNDPRLYRALTRLHAALEEPTTPLHRQSLFMDCLSALLTGYCEETLRPDHPPGRRGLVWARDFLRENLSEKITLRQLAEIAGLSQFHFQRAFAREFGLPPHRYHTSLRIAKVRQSLRAGYPADDAAIEAGFCDQSHMIRHFKAAVGVTPATYAAMVKLRPGTGDMVSFPA